MTKYCDSHKDKWRKRTGRICVITIVVLFICLFIILITWAILQPRKPRFMIQDATIFNFNVSAPNIISSNLQVTILSRNPNDKIGIYYDELRIYATYHSQQITFYTTIPDGYQGHKDSNVWSPFLYGSNVPIAPYNGKLLSDDKDMGSVEMLIKIDGRIKWKVGAVTTGRYHIHVRCPAVIQFGNRNNNNGMFIDTAVKFQLNRGCSVSL